jgi:putative aminopeptidase FrvX
MKFALLLLSVLSSFRQLAAQDVSSLSERLSALTAVTGSERALTDSLLAWLPGSARDRFGNVTLALGKGEPKRLASCAVDEMGYIVGNITDDGYIRLRRVPGALPQPLFDQQMLEGQRVTVMGDAGPVQGVVAVRSTHLTRFRGAAAAAEPPFTVDDAWLDVGATSRADVARLGIRVLSAVARVKRPLRYGDGLLAAPFAGSRATCAALLAAALAKPTARGTVVVAFTIQSTYAQTGLKAVRALQGPFAAELAPSVPSQYRFTPVETVSLAAADSVRKAIVQWIGGAR